MRHFTILGLAGTLLLSVSSFGQMSLTDAQVTAAIAHALSGKRHEIGLSLNDVQTNIFSGLMCKTCGTSGYTIFVYTPQSWIELQAVQARRELLPFGLENVTLEMRLPYIHVLASPSKPEYLDANGMAMASSVHRIVLSSTDRSDVVQPLSESHSAVESNSAFRSFTQASAGAVFSVEDVKRLRSEDSKREFFIVVVGDNKNKYFKVKGRFFNQLFGADAGFADAEPNNTAAHEPVVIEKPATENKQERSALVARKSETSTQRETSTPTVPTSAQQPKTVKYSQRHEPVNTPPPQRTPEVVSTKPILTVGTANSPPVPARPRPTEMIEHASATPTMEMTELSREYDAFQHDNSLIAEWWHLREPGANNSPQTIDPKFNGSGTSTEESSIGAWSNEKPRIRHDGVKIDRIAVDGPADQAGLQVGDEILAIDGIYVFTVEELNDNIRRFTAGKRVSLRYRRRSTIYDTFVFIGSEASVSVQKVKTAEEPY